MKTEERTRINAGRHRVAGQMAESPLRTFSFTANHLHLSVCIRVHPRLKKLFRKRLNLVRNQVNSNAVSPPASRSAELAMVASLPSLRHAAALFPARPAMLGGGDRGVRAHLPRWSSTSCTCLSIL